MTALSDDAKQVAGGLFSMGSKTRVTFGMVESRPTARCQAGLDEMVAAGIITRTGLPGGGVEYVGSPACREFFGWMMRHAESVDPIRIVEPIEVAS